MEDREAAARDELARAEAGLPQREITMQHWQHMQAGALIELYAGAPAKAVELMNRQLPAIRRAFLLRVYVVRAFTAYVRMTAWPGALTGVRPTRRACARLSGASARASARISSRARCRFWSAPSSRFCAAISMRPLKAIAVPRPDSMHSTWRCSHRQRAGGSASYSAATRGAHASTR